MNAINTSEADIGYCVIEFEFNADGQTICSTMRCPINIAEDLYCAVAMEATLTQGLTREKLIKIIIATFKDMFGSQIIKITQAH